MKDKQDRKESWLFSESFIKRSLAVAGHNIVGWIIIYIVVLVFLVLLGMVIGILS